MKNAEKSNRMRFTRKTLDNLELPKVGQRVIYIDSASRNLMLRVSHTGIKTFLWRRKFKGRSYSIMIGRYPEISISEARARALEMGVAMNRGQIRSPREADKTTLGFIFKKYIEEHAKPRSVHWRAIEGSLRRSFQDWSGIAITEITKLRVQERLNQIENDRGRHTANRALVDGKAAIAWAARHELIADHNPFKGIAKFHTQARERFLTPDELPIFFNALKRMTNQCVRDYIFLSLFTGARRGNILAMRWEDIDLDLCVWCIPKTKNGASHVVPLTSYAISVLKDRLEYVKGPWVFPGTGKTGHLIEPIKAWRRLMRECGLKNVRLHDLRRSLGSYMAMSNTSLHIIGQALGHKSTAATQIYARLAHTPVRAAMEEAQATMIELARKLPSGSGLVSEQAVD